LVAAEAVRTAFIQTVAAVVFVVCLLLSPGLWYWIVALIACVLLVGKFSKMVEVESGGPKMPLLPSAFAGLGLGVLHKSLDPQCSVNRFFSTF